MSNNFFFFIISFFVGCSVSLGQCVSSISLGADINICGGPCQTLDAGAGYSGYLWSTGDTTQTISVCSSGNYWVKVINSTPVNLVVNGDFEAGDTAFTSDYVIGPGGTFGPLSIAGSYLVTSNTNSAHNNFPSCSDNTVVGTEMMVVNGSGVVNQNVWCQTIDVCPNESYDFSTWLWNLDVNVPANLSFFVNGVQLGNNFTANYTGCTWREFTGIWDANGATTANICIVNQNTNLGGNDFALDDITFTSTYIYSDTISVILDTLQPIFNPIGDICQGDNIAPLPLTSINGINGSWTPFLDNTITKTYVFTSTGGGCSTNLTITVNDCSVSDSIFVPNVFTPNGDNDNDLFAVKIVGVSEFSGTIYNRWGQEISNFTQVGISKEILTQLDIWDGRTNSGVRASEGTYFYVFEYVASEDGEVIKKKGTITLL